MDDAEAAALRQRAAEAFMKRPGVHGIALGSREKDGVPTGELALRVYVERKRPKAELPRGQMLPKTFEGLPVDVAEHPLFVTQARPGVPRDSYLGEMSLPTIDDAARDPLRGGIAIQGDDRPTQATLGAIFQATSNPAVGYAISNDHVLVGANGSVTNQAAHHPDQRTSLSFCCSNKIGEIVSGRLDGPHDIACVKLAAGTKWLADVLDLGPVRSRRDISATEAATRTVTVSKRGVRTLLTGGTIVEIGGPFTIVDPETKTPRTTPLAMVIEAAPLDNDAITPTIFSAEGDSGAAVLTDTGNELVAILFAGPGPPPPGGTIPVHARSLAVPIATVLDGFRTHPNAAQRVDLAVATAQTAGAVRTVPGAARLMHAEEAREAAERAEAELSRSTAGPVYLGLYRRHARELSVLVRENRKVTAAWHRSGTAEALQAASRIVLDREAVLPARLSNGLSIPDALAHFGAALRPFASRSLRNDMAALLRRARRGVPDPGGLTFSGLLAFLDALPVPLRMQPEVAR